MSTIRIAAYGQVSEGENAQPPRRRRVRVRRVRKLSAAALLAITVAGCTDLPTGPGPHEWFGVETAGLLPPATLPDLTRWSGSVANGVGGVGLREQVRQLETRSLALLGRGRFQDAADIRQQAVGILVGAIESAPDHELLDASRAGIEEWISQVRSKVPEGVSARFDSEIAMIESGSAREREALSDGDTIGAALELLRAGEQIRNVVPLAIASHAVRQADERIRSLPNGSTDRERADHFLRSAREALEGNDLLLAGRRAVYARQIAEGRRIESEVVDSVE